MKEKNSLATWRELLNMKLSERRKGRKGGRKEKRGSERESKGKEGRVGR